MTEVMLRAVITWNDHDERIGMRVRHRDGDWGYLETIEQYSDGTEIWNVIEVGGAITINTVSDAFVFVPGEKRDFSAHPRRSPQDVSGIALDERAIYPFLLEAFDLQRSLMTTQNEAEKRRVHKAITALQHVLFDNAVQWISIENACVKMLSHWEKDSVQREQIAKEVAQKIAHLRWEGATKET
jgi:hypothetical protein